MSFTDKLKKIDELQAAINSHGKLPDEVLKRINYKFRLEWNYTSNSMEGSTLTREETRSIMVGNITVHGKPVKDVLEMQGHDEVISQILKIGKGDLNLSERRIRDIHKSIMHEENVSERKKIGEWKNEPNHIINYKGEKFDFVAPGEVGERMHKLINWLNSEKEKIERKDKKAEHPVSLALFFHLEFVTIHPFYDGNGRMARILSNLVLISFEYPPLYIKEDEKKTYYQYLADIQAYGGEADLLFEFMADLIIRSQQLVLDAIDGKEIEDPDDLDKKIELLKTQLRGKKKFANVVLGDVESELGKTFFDNFSRHFKEKSKQIGSLFSAINISTTKLNDQLVSLDSWNYPIDSLNTSIGLALDEKYVNNILLDIRYLKFRDPENVFDFRALVLIHLATFTIDFKCIAQKWDWSDQRPTSALFDAEEILVGVPYKKEYTDKEIARLVKTINDKIFVSIANEAGVNM